jgi:uncharacterized repeat protein (TIGR01451 family)
VQLKALLRATAVATAVMAVGLVVGVARADVWTDRYVYHGGDTVAINGDGMQAGESVAVEVFLPDGSLAQHHDVAADDQGAFADSYVLATEAASGIYSVVATGAESGATYSTTFDPIGAGALNCPGLDVHNPTHYKLQVGTTVTCTIDGAEEVSGQSTTTVFIKSSALGNTEITGTVTGTGQDTQITFTYTARDDGCDTTVVAYDKVGTNSNNTIISGDPNSLSAAGFAFVDGNGEVIECGGQGTPGIDILKVADEPSVYWGTTIGFTITVTSTGTATATNVQVSDPLPTDAGTSWSIDGGTGAGDCSISLGNLTCDFGDMAAGAFFTVHISSPTTKNTVADSPVVNTAYVTTDDAGTDESTDDVEVICQRVNLSVKVDASTVPVGGTAGYTVKVSRGALGVVHGVSVTALLPKSLTWTLDGGSGQSLCSVSGTTLSCSFGDMDFGSTYTAHVSAVTLSPGTLLNKVKVFGPNPLMTATSKASITVT